MSQTTASRQPKIPNADSVMDAHDLSNVQHLLLTVRTIKLGSWIFWGGAPT